MTTQTIAGHKITLQPSKRYQAHRSVASRGNINHQRFAVIISELSTGDYLHYANSILGGRNTITKIPDLTYDQANEFLAEFNNEECSLSGRVWE